MVTAFDTRTIRTKEDKSPEHYMLNNEGLETAVQMALWLGKPLLLTGAPGTGKTQLAFKIAYLLAKSVNQNGQAAAPFLEIPFVFNTKTTSIASDLFYTYDAVRHFQQKYVDQFAKSESITTAHRFIKLNALGSAILQSYGAEAISSNPELNDLEQLADFKRAITLPPQSSVVLIDEIDKAPRDFPNDLLNEIENMEFYIKELMNKHIKKATNSNAQVLVIMTSNFEKSLPDAFLRRCLFYHIPFPEPAALVEIVIARIAPYFKNIYNADETRQQQLLADLHANTLTLVDEFVKIRSQIKDKTPATAELLEWIKALEIKGFLKDRVDFKNLDTEKKKILFYSFPALAKSENDLIRLKQLYPLE